jgi:hypothetical protein
MMDISFAWTTPALLAGAKTVTRRDWKDTHARRFNRGMTATALNRQRRFGGKPVALIRLTVQPYKERTCEIPDSDWFEEGFAWLEENGIEKSKLKPREIWLKWKTDRENSLWVVRFQLVKQL